MLVEVVEQREHERHPCVGRLRRDACERRIHGRAGLLCGGGRERRERGDGVGRGERRRRVLAGGAPLFQV